MSKGRGQDLKMKQRKEEYCRESLVERCSWRVERIYQDWERTAKVVEGVRFEV